MPQENGPLFKHFQLPLSRLGYEGIFFSKPQNVTMDQMAVLVFSPEMIQACQHFHYSVDAHNTENQPDPRAQGIW